MPKRKNNNKKNPNAHAPIRKQLVLFTHPGGSSPVHGNKIVRERFRIFTQASASSTTGGTFILSQQDVRITTFGARAIAMADLFQYWRCVDFRFSGRTHPGNSTASIPTPGNVTWMVAVAFTPVSAYTAPTTMPQLVDFPYMHYMNDHPPGVLNMHVPRNQLLGNMPYEWLKTTTTAVNDEDYVQFSVNVGSLPFFSYTNGGGMDIVWDLELEFRGDIDPGLLPKDKLYGLRKLDLLTPPEFLDFAEHK